MVKIVGQEPGREVTCGNCGAVLQFTLSDVTTGDQLVGAEDYGSVIVCPQCKRRVSVTHLVGTTSRETAERERWERDRDDI